MSIPQIVINKMNALVYKDLEIANIAYFIIYFNTIIATTPIVSN